MTVSPRDADVIRRKGTCWKCGRKVRLRKNGTLGGHSKVVWMENGPEFLLDCLATGTPPRETKS